MNSAARKALCKMAGHMDDVIWNLDFLCSDRAISTDPYYQELRDQLVKVSVEIDQKIKEETR